MNTIYLWDCVLGGNLWPPYCYDHDCKRCKPFLADFPHEVSEGDARHRNDHFGFDENSKKLEKNGHKEEHTEWWGRIMGVVAPRMPSIPDAGGKVQLHGPR